MTVTIAPRAALITLSAAATLILAAFVAGLVSTYGFGHDYALGLVPAFDLDEEANVPTFFSVVLLLLASLLLALIATARGRSHAGDHRWWAGLFAVFLFLAMDEMTEIHERLIAPVKNAVGASGLLYYAWVIPYAIVGAVLLLVFVQFLRRLPPRTRRRIFTAGVLYVGGAFGCELASGFYVDRTGTEETLTHDLLILLEESLEMAGAIWFIYALLAYVESEMPDFAVRIGRNSPP